MGISRYEQLTDSCLLEFQLEDSGLELSNKVITWYTFQNANEILVLPEINKLTDETKTLPGLHINSFNVDNEDDRYFTFKEQHETSKSILSAIPQNRYIRNTFVSTCPLVNNRFMFRTGYIVPDTGLFIKYKCQNVTFMNMLITRERFRSLVKFLPSPKIIGTKVYDRYIDVKSLNLRELGYINDQLSTYLALGVDPMFQIEVTTVDQYFNPTNADAYEYDLVQTKAMHTIPYSSVFDNFNVVITDNKESNYIEYYPVWGEFIPKANVLPKLLDKSIIAKLSNGEIRSVYNPQYHEKDEEYFDMYGDKLKWCTVHELIFTEIYSNDTAIVGQEIEQKVRKMEFIEEYDTISNPEYLKYKIRPVLDSPNNQFLIRLLVQYNCRLWNRQDNTQIVRSTNLVIDNPLKRYGNDAQKLEAQSINKFIIFNKREDNKAPVEIRNTEPVVKYEKIFVESQNILCNVDNIISENGIIDTKNIFETGPYLNLYPTSHFYKWRFVREYKNKTGEIGYKAIDLSGPYKFVLRLYDNDDYPVDINIDYSSDDINPVLGELQFYVTEDIINRISKTSRKTWSILCLTQTGLESTLATGNVNFR